MTEPLDVAERAAALVETPPDDLLALAEALVAVPSPSLREEDLSGAVVAWLSRHAPGLGVDTLGANVVARTDWGRPERVVLGGHLDTVPPSGNELPRREGDVLWGLGAADMKGGLAVMLRLAAEAAARGGRAARDVTLVWYEAEEVADEHNGLRRLLAERPELLAGDLAVLLEPTDGWVEAGCQGTLHVRATYRGARAHTARPWMGDNAIHRAAEAIVRVGRHATDTVEVDGLAYRESCQVVGVEGGVAHNVVPDECVLVVNRRVAPAYSLEEAEAQVRELLGEPDQVEVLNASPPAPPMLADARVAAFVAAGELAVRPKLGWTDVARFAAQGVPALNFGPGDPEISHTADERVDRASIERAHRVLAGYLGLG